MLLYPRHELFKFYSFCMKWGRGTGIPVDHSFEQTLWGDEGLLHAATGGGFLFFSYSINVGLKTSAP